MSKIVKILNDKDLKTLRLIYLNHIPRASHVVSLIDNYLSIKSKCAQNGDVFEFLGLDDEWKTNGTFLMKFKNYDLFVYTLSQNQEEFYELLTYSKALKVQRRTVCYGIRNEHLIPLYKSIENEVNSKLGDSIECWMYWLSKEKALQYKIQCPEDVYISNLSKIHSKQISDLWPHSFDSAEEYVSLLIEISGGYGVFLKENHKLVSWILKTHWGTLALLETLPEYKRKGYGALVTKKLCLEIAKEGINPLCTIVVGNTLSKGLFEKMGFERIGNCTFVIVYPK